MAINSSVGQSLAVRDKNRETGRLCAKLLEVKAEKSKEL
jgi:hypothetical protein